MAPGRCRFIAPFCRSSPDRFFRGRHAVVVAFANYSTFFVGLNERGALVPKRERFRWWKGALNIPGYD